MHASNQNSLGLQVVAPNSSDLLQQDSQLSPAAMHVAADGTAVSPGGLGGVFGT